MNFEQKMDQVVETIFQTMNELDLLDDEDFSVSLAAFRIVASMAMSEGWELDDLKQHLDEEWQLSQELAEDYRKTLN